jgi:hypothetical protein
MTGSIYNGKPWIAGVALKRGTREISMEHGRHHMLIVKAVRDFGWAKPVRGDEQGFMVRTVLGGTDRFVTREEAEPIARAAGQLTGPLIGGPLTSEDLW